MIKENMKARILGSLLIIMSLSAITSLSQIAAGGIYTLDQTVIATGGGTSTAGVYKADMTVGQSVAGQRASQSPYTLHAGFWNAQSIGPSAASVSVSGCVTTADGRGIRNVRIAISSGDGQVRTVVTGSLGVYRLDDVAIGQTYIVEIRSDRFHFEPSIRVVTIMDELADFNFSAQEN